MRKQLLSARVGITMVPLLVLLAMFRPSPVSATLSPLSTAAVLHAAAPAGAVQAGAAVGVIRSRAVAIDVSTLPDPRARRQLAREPNLRLELFPDALVEAEFDRFDDNPTGVTWVGHLVGAPFNPVTLVYRDGLLVATVSTPGGMFQIRPAPEAVRLANPQPRGQVHQITQVDTRQLPREAEPLQPTLLAPSGAEPPVMADTADVIDLLVLYTPAALADYEGEANMAIVIELLVSETNSSYANSDIAQRIRVVHTAQVTYSEADSSVTDLVSLRAGSGAGLAGVPALRDQYGADLVTMMVHRPLPDACGVAYVNAEASAAFAPFGYSVTDTACFIEYTFAHELGHNMGAQHDWYVNQSTMPFTYAHGYVNPAPDAPWRTIMASPLQCLAQRFWCDRLLAWSNPGNRLITACLGPYNFRCNPDLWFFPGTAPSMGIPGGTRSDCRFGDPDTGCDADNHRTLNNTAIVTANLRQSTTTGIGRR